MSNNWKQNLQAWRTFKRVESANKLMEKLLSRQFEDNYVQEWTVLLKHERDQPTIAPEISLLIFRINDEWLAFSTHVLFEIIERRKIHSIPHRSKDILLGCVNLRGQLKLCISLEKLLEIEESFHPSPAKTIGPASFRRMMAIEKNHDCFVFPVDEVWGVQHFDSTQLENVPVTVVKSKANFLKGIVVWNNNNVGLLDEELIFYSLRKIVL